VAPPTNTSSPSIGRSNTAVASDEGVPRDSINSGRWVFRPHPRVSCCSTKMRLFNDLGLSGHFMQVLANHVKSSLAGRRDLLHVGLVQGQFGAHAQHGDRRS
jgi:hypothetical protein